MAFFLNKTSIASHFRSHSLLLAEDPFLKPFKSYKKSVLRLKRIGDVLTVAVVAGCCYEIYVKAAMREEARKQVTALKSAQ